MSIYDRILITGGGGMLAKALILSLKSRGHEPTAPSRAALDIVSFADVMQTVEKLRPTLILNCAAHTKVDLCEKEETLATEINGSARGGGEGCGGQVRPFQHGFCLQRGFESSLARG
jgi:dTDP-4-dehydrorhamnose reductase